MCQSKATCPSTDCCFSGQAINLECIVWNQLIGNALYRTDHMGRSCMEPKNWECTVWNQSILKILFEIKELSLIGPINWKYTVWGNSIRDTL